MPFYGMLIVYIAAIRFPNVLNTLCFVGTRVFRAMGPLPFLEETFAQPRSLARTHARTHALACMHTWPPCARMVPAARR